MTTTATAPYGFDGLKRYLSQNGVTTPDQNLKIKLRKMFPSCNLEQIFLDEDEANRVLQQFSATPNTAPTLPQQVDGAIASTDPSGALTEDIRQGLDEALDSMVEPAAAYVAQALPDFYAKVFHKASAIQQIAGA